MSVTLETLYNKVKNHKEIKLVAGEKGLDKIVSWVHMVEGTDISSFLEGNEIAFTTGIALDKNNIDKELYDLVKLNYKQKATGMVINIGPYINKISDEILQFGNENNFPIFEVPWRVHMANIMREFSVEINLCEQQELEIVSALKNAITFPENEILYVPTLLKYGYKREWSYCIVVAEIYNKQSMALKSSEKNNLLRYTRRYFSSWGQKAAIWEFDEKLVFFFANCKTEKVKKEMEKFWNETKSYMLPKAILYSGIGRATKSMHCIGKSFVQAEKIKNLKKQKKEKNTFTTYNELGIYKLLLSIEDKEPIQEYYEETLGRLEEYDHINETDYFYFLEQYFELGCSVQDLASKMYIHRNSVTYKLHKIEEILNMDISKQENRIILMVAFMVRKIKY